MRRRLKSGDMGTTAGDLRDLKIAALELRENELRLFLRGGATAWTMVLRGIIAFRDTGAIGRPLGGYAIEDRGSFKELRVRRAPGPGRDGGILLRCEYLEGDVEPG